jgi:hypothetical protein
MLADRRVRLIVIALGALGFFRIRMIMIADGFPPDQELNPAIGEHAPLPTSRLRRSPEPGSTLRPLSPRE